MATNKKAPETPELESDFEASMKMVAEKAKQEEASRPEPRKKAPAKAEQHRPKATQAQPRREPVQVMTPFQKDRTGWQYKLKWSAIWAGIFGAPVLVFWGWQQAEMMATGPAQLCMLTCAMIGAFKVGTICRQE